MRVVVVAKRKVRKAAKGRKAIQTVTSVISARSVKVALGTRRSGNVFEMRKGRLLDTGRHGMSLVMVRFRFVCVSSGGGDMVLTHVHIICPYF
jgi:hypothetical protein